VSASAELADLLAEQRRAVALARGAAAEVTAPEGLRARIEAQSRARLSRARRPVRFVLHRHARDSRTLGNGYPAPVS
jgi:ubiquinone biosynthesis protein COQ9